MMLSSGTNPYLGLRPFGVEDAEVFFGRDDLVNRLLGRLARSRLVVVTGRSGAGKSSLVRAGMVPALLAGIQTSSHWRVATMRPGSAPLATLASELSRPEVLGGRHPAEMAELLGGSGLGLVQATREASLPVGTSLLLIVDQFEEIFRYAVAAAQDESAGFVQLLLEAAAHPDVAVYVVLTVRTDYLGDCERFRGLPESVSDGLLLVPRMTRSDFRRAIEGPAAMAESRIALRLVDRLLNDASEEPDQLALLQHTLLRTWDRWHESGQSGPVDLEHYDAIGTITHALDADLEGVFAQLPDSQMAIAKKMFQRLIELDEYGRDTRRPTTLAEICAVAEAKSDEAIAVIESFRSPSHRFLLPGWEYPLQRETVIDITHEAVIRRWSRLQEWAREERRSAEFYVQVARAAALHRRGEAGHYRQPELSIAQRWREHARPNHSWAQRYHPEFETAMAFLDLSQESELQERALEQERLYQERAQQERIREEQQAHFRQQLTRMRSWTRIMLFMLLAFVTFVILYLMRYA